MENFSPGLDFSPVSLGNVNKTSFRLHDKRFSFGLEFSARFAPTGLEFSARAEVLHVMGPLETMKSILLQNTASEYGVDNFKVCNLF